MQRILFTYIMKVVTEINFCKERKIFYDYEWEKIENTRYSDYNRLSWRG